MLRELLLAALVLVPGAAAAADEAAAPPERLWSVEARTGAGVDSNVLHDPQSSRQSGVARVDLTTELEPMRNLRLSLVGWFDEHLPYYDLNEASAQLLVLFHRPIANHLSLKVGSFGDYHRELSTFFEGTVYTHGATLLNEVGEHASVGLVARLGPFDIETGVQGHIKDVEGTQSFTVFGVDGNASVRWVPTQSFSLRVRYLFLFEDVRDLPLHALNGQLTDVHRDLQILTHQVDLTAHLRPMDALHLFVRYELALIDDNFVGYLYGQEHRLVGELRFDDERRWVVDLFGKMVYRSYPNRDPSADNQSTDLPFEVVADVELRFSAHWGVFARYQFDAEAANPYGLIYLRHSAVVGIAGRAGGRW